MELVESARILWRSRAVTGAALLVSALIGLLVAFRPSVIPPGLHARTHTVGQAAAQVLIDTQHSQISDVAPAGAQNLYARAALLADILATAPSQERLARMLRIDPRRLQVTPPAGSGLAPIRPTALGSAASAGATVTPSWSLTVTLDPTLPLIGLTAQAPTVLDAQAMSRDAITILDQQVRGSATAQGIPPAQQVVVNTISPPVAAPKITGIRKLYGLAAMVAAFCLSAIAIVLWEGSALARRARARAPRRRLPTALEPLRPRTLLRALLEAVGVRGPATGRTQRPVTREAREAREGASPVGRTGEQPETERAAIS